MAVPTTDGLDTVRSRRGGRSARVRHAVLTAAIDELVECGYENLSHLTVARIAGVDPATVYRRWPTRGRLAVDAIVELAAEAVPLPDTGTVRGDLTALHRAVSRVLRNPRLLRLFQAVSAAAFEHDPEVTDAVRAFWRQRFDGAVVILTRAVERGEIPPQPDPRGVIEQLVAPAYFRALVTKQALDARLTETSVERALTLARSISTATSGGSITS
jgi:AcrR family transcriptional regulator